MKISSPFSTRLLKGALVATCALFIHSLGFAQNVFPANGNVGIGLSSPSSLLHINKSDFGTTRLTITNSYANASHWTSYWKAGQVSNVDGQTGILMINPNAGTGFTNGFYLGLDQATSFKSYTIGSKDATPLGFYTSGDEKLRIDAAGNVGIGTADTKGYKLGVNGSVIATSMTVKLYGNWPDFVFAKTYGLRPLSEVESFIKENSHLPEVPSAAQVAKEGINLGEMDAILLKKIEELTLYMIEFKKEHEELKKENAEIKAELKTKQ